MTKWNTSIGLDQVGRVKKGTSFYRKAKKRIERSEKKLWQRVLERIAIAVLTAVAKKEFKNKFKL
jgi:hypothetical protein